MNWLIFFIIIVQFIIVIVLSVNTFKEQLLSFKYGIRRKTAFFIDTRDKVRVTLNQEMKKFEYMGLDYIWNFEKEKNGGCIFITANAEALEVSLDIEKCRYWCDSNEYHTNLKNQLLETLMMLKSRDTIIMILIICLVAVIVSAAIMFFRTGSIIESTTNIENSLTAINNTMSGNLRVI